MNSTELMAVYAGEGLTYRKLDYWCSQGVFGPDKARSGQGRRRYFSDYEGYIVGTLARVSVAFETWSCSSVKVFREIARQMYEGNEEVCVVIGPGVAITVDAQRSMDVT